MTTDAEMIKAFFFSKRKLKMQFQLQLFILCVLKVIYKVNLLNKRNNTDHGMRIWYAWIKIFAFGSSRRK